MNETFLGLPGWLPQGLLSNAASTEWLNKADNARELIAATMVGPPKRSWARDFCMGSCGWDGRDSTVDLRCRRAHHRAGHPQHPYLQRHKPTGVALPGHGRIQEQLRHWGSPRNDHRPCLHHTWRSIHEMANLAGVVEPWAAIIMGIMSGSIPWYTMMVLHRRSAFFQSVDNTLGVFHAHAVARLLGELLSGILAKPRLLRMFSGNTNKYGPVLLYTIIEGPFHHGVRQVLLQLLGAAYITFWNVVMTSLICIFISWFVNLRMDKEDLEIGVDAVHGEEAYALWGDGERHPLQFRITPPRFRSFFKRH
ncbi:ammonium transporter 2 [Actinidia rufa]|uniref:Ammonium transporter 2 n=1 Tax=Actinidia rufa TaxID=165716 RepID=A0A7J0EN76_9ERIC|nr:ammonium transporter 2 [Actinidia rufa]